ncbi:MULTISPECIES: UvrB/UvrC motif-containing protein [Sporosarcina]|uniref:UvrB/UvrC motif-containing protein n=1 Tax=Sporosarcina TaxID=1569 RepID=UPI00058F8EB9|nr:MULTISPECIES: UvrB/UvrC motif-containing protein [Sporosarcina]WJY26979.1 UvrB/UvrC motif-containing protein [Sporosarcina sp. 0.2-SM1T-5]
MLCENCKERPVSVILKQETPNGPVERNLCDQCAFNLQTFSFSPQQEPMSIQQFLSQWLTGEAIQPQTRGNQGMPECPECGLTFHRFLEIGKFGCPVCYDTFRERLPRVFGKLHNGSTAHTGKIPASFNEKMTIRKKIEALRASMQEAIQEERFEQAAVLRDEVNEWKRKLAAEPAEGGISDGE